MGVVTERKIGQCLINNKAMVIVNGYRCSLVSLKCINLRCEHCEEE